MARVSIYVPDELKVRMDEAAEAVNWSEVARPSFQAALATYEHRKGQSMETAIERLKASKERYLQAAAADGKEHGRTWAQDRADYEELLAISQIELQGDIEGANNALKQAVDPNDELNWLEFNEAQFGDEKGVSDAYAFAFIEGAQEFFEEVKDQL